MYFQSPIVTKNYLLPATTCVFRLFLVLIIVFFSHSTAAKPQEKIIHDLTILPKIQVQSLAIDIDKILLQLSGNVYCQLGQQALQAHSSNIKRQTWSSTRLPFTTTIMAHGLASLAQLKDHLKQESNLQVSISSPLNRKISYGGRLYKASLAKCGHITAHHDEALETKISFPLAVYRQETPSTIHQFTVSSNEQLPLKLGIVGELDDGVTNAAFFIPLQNIPSPELIYLYEQLYERYQTLQKWKLTFFDLLYTSSDCVTIPRFQILYPYNELANSVAKNPTLIETIRQTRPISRFPFHEAIPLCSKAKVIYRTGISDKRVNTQFIAELKNGFTSYICRKQNINKRLAATKDSSRKFVIDMKKTADICGTKAALKAIKFQTFKVEKWFKEELQKGQKNKADISDEFFHLAFAAPLSKETRKALIQHRLSSIKNTEPPSLSKLQTIIDLAQKHPKKFDLQQRREIQQFIVQLIQKRKYFYEADMASWLKRNRIFLGTEANQLEDSLRENSRKLLLSLIENGEVKASYKVIFDLHNHHPDIFHQSWKQQLTIDVRKHPQFASYTRLENCLQSLSGYTLCEAKNSSYCQKTCSADEKCKCCYATIKKKREMCMQNLE